MLGWSNLFVILVGISIVAVQLVLAEEHEDNTVTQTPVYPKYEETWKSTTNSTYVRSFSQVTYLDIDSKDNISLLDQRAIYRISPKGEFLSYWSNLNFYGFTDIDTNSKNEIYAAVSRESQILKISEEGKILETWGPFEINDIDIDFPGDKNLNIFVDNSDNLYISKFNSENPFTGQVKKFSSTGQILKIFDNMAHPIIQDSSGNLYGRTFENIIKYDPNGNKLVEFGGYVVDLAIDQNDVIYATHGSKKSPSMFSKSGEKFVSFGGVGIGDEKFREPRGIAVNSEGKIFVADYGKTTLLVFSPYVGPSEPVEPAPTSSMSAEESQQRYDAEIYKNYLEYEEAIKSGYTQEEIIQAYEEQIAREQIQEDEPFESKNEIICGPGTILNEENLCVPEKIIDETSSKSPSSGGCLIATATFGSELAPQVQLLREVRDNTLLGTTSGTLFMTGFNQIYYSFSPTIADWERQNPIFKETVKLAITPLITSLSILNYVEMDSEVEVLGYGISLIILNVGMYVVAPIGIGLALVRRKQLPRIRCTRP